MWKSCKHHNGIALTFAKWWAFQPISLKSEPHKNMMVVTAGGIVVVPTQEVVFVAGMCSVIVIANPTITKAKTTTLMIVTATTMTTLTQSQGHHETQVIKIMAIMFMKIHGSIEETTILLPWGTPKPNFFIWTLTNNLSCKPQKLVLNLIPTVKHLTPQETYLGSTQIFR